MLRDKRYYVISVIMVLITVCLDLAAKKYNSNSLHARARLTVVSDAATASTLEEKAHKASRIAMTMSLVGVLLALSSLVSWIMSIRNKEPVRQYIPGVLLFIFLLLQLIII